MQVANGANSYFWNWCDEYYSGGITSQVTQAGLQQQMAILSQRLPAAVRDFIMTRFASMMVTWAPGFPPYNIWPQLTEPSYANLQTEYRKRSGGGSGWRSEYVNPENLDGTLGPGWTTGSPAQSGFSDTRTNPPGGHKAGLQAAMSSVTQDSTALTVGTINQVRVSTTVTLTFTAAHTVFGIRNVSYIQYAADGSTVVAQGEAVMVFNANGGTTSTNFNNAFMDCTVTITNAVANNYVILNIYSTTGQRTSRRVQLA